MTVQLPWRSALTQQRALDLSTRPDHYDPSGALCCRMCWHLARTATPLRYGRASGASVLCTTCYDWTRRHARQLLGALPKRNAIPHAVSRPVRALTVADIEALASKDDRFDASGALCCRLCWYTRFHEEPLVTPDGYAHGGRCFCDACYMYVYRNFVALMPLFPPRKSGRKPGRPVVRRAA